MLWRVAAPPSSWLHNIPVYFIYPFTHRWTFDCSQSLAIVNLGVVTFVTKLLFAHLFSFLLDVYPGTEIQAHVVTAHSPQQLPHQP